MSPIATAMLTKVLLGAGVLFVIAYIGNLLSFSNKLVNALVTAVVFAVVYAGLFYLVDQATLPADLREVTQETWIQVIAMSAVVVFVVDLVANMLSFSNRFMSALVTALLFVALFGTLFYLTGDVAPNIPA